MQSAAERNAQRRELAELRERVTTEARAAKRMAQKAGLMARKKHHAAEAMEQIGRAYVCLALNIQPGERWA